MPKTVMLASSGTPGKGTHISAVLSTPGNSVSARPNSARAYVLYRESHPYLAETTVASPYPCDIASARGLPTCAHLYPLRPFRDQLGQKTPIQE